MQLEPQLWPLQQVPLSQALSPVQLRSQLDALQFNELQVSSPSQLTLQSVPAQVTPPAQAVSPLHVMSQAVALLQSTPPAHTSLPVQVTRHGRSGGQTISLSQLASLHVITHVPLPSQLSQTPGQGSGPSGLLAASIAAGPASTCVPVGASAVVELASAV